ncbi:MULTISPECIES: hypothetical protein [unclassified Mesobacillus]|uniref:hypothetical protein n=1 Tax=unclassified Mesobacillus TaxID=2675270 RepID=UPI00203F49F9|nr:MULTISPECIES: hypothetical protein [unclassified Mesobacillus]MCM3122033.1 hypothetical protein [Mesobacillus sp. MER 33]MCM3231997.1 hypothetical protein [Mesobacillus sp. MER 48]
MSCGRSWSGETPQEQSDEEAQRQPQGRIAYEKDGLWSFSYSSSGKRSAWNENQQPCLTVPMNKEMIDGKANNKQIQVGLNYLIIIAI